MPALDLEVAFRIARRRAQVPELGNPDGLLKVSGGKWRLSEK
jgi:hypothetical protein